MNPIDDIWIQLGIKQMDIFDQNNEAYMSMLVNGTSLVSIWKVVYERAIALKVLTPLDETPSDYKRLLWREAYDLSKGKLNKEEMSSLCRALYTMKNYAGQN